MSESDTSNNRT